MAQRNSALNDVIDALPDTVESIAEVDTDDPREIAVITEITN